MGLDLAALADCALLRWRPQIGDPSTLGWLTVAAYAVAAALALARVGGARGAERAFWAGLAAGMAALAVNKQLDLQSLLTAVGRCHAQAQGWYEQRRAAQAVFVLALAGGVGLAGLALVWALRRALGRIWLALLGATLVVGFVLVRAVGFHHMDALIGASLVGWRLNWIFELGGIALVCLGALRGRARSDGQQRADRRSLG